jgi:putative FmdB family regulatory protein
LPIYEYRCTKCSHDFDMRKGFGENSSAPCPMCQEEAQRIFSPVPIIFKGSGFYVTDCKPQEKSEPENEKVGSCTGAESKSEED